MKIFLTGATGYIGTALTEQLQATGHTIVGLTHNPARVADLKARNIEPLVGDVRQPAFLAEAAKEADAVIHTALFTLEGIGRAFEVDYEVVRVLAEALAGSGKPFIVSSSTVSLGDTGAEPVDESASVDWTGGRARIERVALDAAKETVRSVVLRVPLYPYGRGGSIFVPFLIQKALENGFSYYVGSGDNKLSAVHVDDVARLYIQALEKAPAGSLYHVSTQNGVTSRAIAQAIGRLTDLPVKGLSIEEATPVFGEFAFPLSWNSQVDAAKAYRELGWQAESTPSILDDIEHGSYHQLIKK